MSKKKDVFSSLFYVILFLIFLKFTFSYLNVELGWWLRHLTPNIDKYNFLGLPPDFQEYVEFLLIPAMVFYLFSNLSKLGAMLFPFILTFVMYFLNVGTAIYNDISVIDSLTFSLKICSPVYFLMVILVEHKRKQFDIETVLFRFIYYLLFLSVIALLVFDVSYNRDSERWPVYFSGLHTHNYVMVCLFIGIAMRIRDRYYALYAFMFFTFVFLILGYNVRTALLFYLVFILVMLYKTNSFFKYAYAKAIIYLPFLLVFAIAILSTVDLDSLSSGRITMYLTKLDILKDYSFTDYLFGRGKGSDMVRTSEWWWEKKGSHNDFLTYIVENGIPFTILFATLITSLLTISRKISVFNIALIIGYFITSLFSNGFATRPLAADIFFLVYAYIYINKSSTQPRWEGK